MSRRVARLQPLQLVRCVGKDAPQPEQTDRAICYGQAAAPLLSAKGRCLKASVWLSAKAAMQRQCTLVRHWLPALASM